LDGKSVMKFAVPAGAPKQETCRRRFETIVIAVIGTSRRHQRFGAPRATTKHESAFWSIRSKDLRRQSVRLLEGIRGGFFAAADPKSDVDGMDSRNQVLSPHVLQCARESGSSFELLVRQQSQCVTAHYRCSAAEIAMNKPAPNDHKGRKQQICLRLTTAGREPDQIHQIPSVVRIRAYRPGHWQKLER